MNGNQVLEIVEKNMAWIKANQHRRNDLYYKMVSDRVDAGLHILDLIEEFQKLEDPE